MNGFLRDRVRLTAGLLLGISAVCTAALFWGAGENAAQAFSLRREQSSAQTLAQGRQDDSLAALLPLAGFTVAVDPGHGGYDGGAVGRVSGTPEKGLNLDVALQLAIAYIWITEDRYDKDYIAAHAYGFDKFEDYVLGREDGVPKTPAWASEKCGVKEWTMPE